MDGRRWLPRGPLLSPALRPAAAWFVIGCTIVTAAGGVLTAHHTQADWLDHSIDARIQSALAAHNGLLVAVADIAKPSRVALLITALVVACVAVRRLDGALLAIVAVPAAILLTEGLKQLFDRTLNGAPVYPSGHTATAFALAAVVMILMLSPSRHVLPFAFRLAVTFAAMLIGCAVALAVIGLNWHYFTDTLAGTAVGVGTVVGVSLVIDLAFRHVAVPGPATGPEQAVNADQVSADRDSSPRL